MIIELSMAERMTPCTLYDPCNWKRVVIIITAGKVNGWKTMSQKPREVPDGMSQLSEEPQRIPHLEHGEQLQLDGKRHVGGTCAVHGVTCALHEH